MCGKPGKRRSRDERAGASTRQTFKWGKSSSGRVWGQAANLAPEGATRWQAGRNHHVMTADEDFSWRDSPHASRVLNEAATSNAGVREVLVEPLTRGQ